MAVKGIPSAFPNPLVGSVIIHNGKVIGEGYHKQYGEAHAEVNAIKSVKNKSLLRESILYVNLEPCAHFGKTPPCSDLIIKHKIPHVVIGCVDTFSKVAGKGIEKLQNAGVKVEVGVLEKESREINKRFFTFHEQKRPYVILKWARTKSGFIAPAKNHNQNRWITSKNTQVLVHKWRTQEAAILVGKNTVVKDNPSLTAREWEGKNPIRCVIDKNLETVSGNYNIYHADVPTIIFNDIKNEKNKNLTFVKLTFKDLLVPQILNYLHQLNIQSLIVEGGTITLQNFIDLNLYDEVRVLEGNGSFNEGLKQPVLEDVLYNKQQLGNDMLFTYKKEVK